MIYGVPIPVNIKELVESIKVENCTVKSVRRMTKGKKQNQY